MSGEEEFVGFAQCFDVDAGLWLDDLLHGGDDLFAVEGWVVDVATQGGGDGLLDGVEQTGSFLYGNLIERGLDDGGNDLFLQGENVYFLPGGYDAGRIGLALDQVGENVAVVFDATTAPISGEVNVTPVMLFVASGSSSWSAFCRVAALRR